MQKMGWFGVVRGHSRSSAMSPFDRAHTTSYSTLIESMCILYRFRDKAGYSSKVADFDPPHLHLAPSQGVTPVEFRGDLWHQKTRVPVLSCGVVCVIVCLAVLVELRLVTDRQTQTQAHGQYHGCIASRGKNQVMPHVAFHTFTVPDSPSPAFSSLAFFSSPLQLSTQSLDLVWSLRYSIVTVIVLPTSRTWTFVSLQIFVVEKNITFCTRQI